MLKLGLLSQLRTFVLLLAAGACVTVAAFPCSTCVAVCKWEVSLLFRLLVATRLVAQDSIEKRRPSLFQVGLLLVTLAWSVLTAADACGVVCC